MLTMLAVIVVIVLLAVAGARMSLGIRRPTKGVELVDMPMWDTASTLVDQPIYGEDNKPVDWDEHYDRNYSQWDDVI